MAYDKNTWVDQSVERPKTYEMNNNADGSITLVDSFGLVSELGTPVNAVNMNHLEEGIAACDLRKYSVTEIFEKNEWATAIVDGEKKIFQSLKDDNQGNPVTDSAWWSELKLGGSGGGISLPLFTPVIQDRVLSFNESKGYALQGTYVYKEASTQRHGYPTFYAKCLEEKTSGVETQTTLGGSTITTYNNANGHIYYDIADKAIVDAYYDSTGLAWMYGLDEENERVFLPRGYASFAEGSKEQIVTAPLLGSKTSGFGDVGLPDANGTYHTVFAQDGSGRVWINDATITNSNQYNVKVTIPKAESASAYLYIVVGNTEEEKAITEVTDVTTSENDTIPLGYSTYQEGGQPSVSWLASNGQWNNGRMYESFYNYFTQYIGQKFGAGYIRNHTESYDDYDLVMNQEETTFRLPLKNGNEYMPNWKNPKTLGISIKGNSYTVLQTGYYTINVSKDTPAAGAGISVNGIRVDTISVSDGWESSDCVVFLAKGDVVTSIDTVYSASVRAFIPVIGIGTLYYKVANAVQNLELLDAGKVLEELSSKTDKLQAAKASMPSERYIALTLGTDGAQYTAPADGWVCFRFEATSSNSYVQIDNIAGLADEKLVAASGNYSSVSLPVIKGQTFHLYYRTVKNRTFKFIYAEGAKND